MSDPNGDGIVSRDDLREILSHLGTVLGDYNYSAASDLDNNGRVDDEDVRLMIGELSFQPIGLKLAA